MLKQWDQKQKQWDHLPKQGKMADRLAIRLKV